MKRWSLCVCLWSVSGDEEKNTFTRNAFLSLARTHTESFWRQRFEDRRFWVPVSVLLSDALQADRFISHVTFQKQTCVWWMSRGQRSSCQSAHVFFCRAAMFLHSHWAACVEILHLHLSARLHLFTVIKQQSNFFFVWTFFSTADTLMFSTTADTTQLLTSRHKK